MTSLKRAVVLSVLLLTVGCSQDACHNPGGINRYGVKPKAADVTHGYPVRITLSVEGCDGTLSKCWDTSLPAVPRPGDKIDIFRVVEVAWATRLGRFVVTLEKAAMPDRKAEEAFRVVAPSAGKWQTLLFFKRGCP